MNPEEYLTQTIKMSGEVGVYQDATTGNTYYAVMISDADGCSQGIEFELVDGYEYPEMGAIVTVIGTIETYEEGGLIYLHAANASIIG